jgi:hypothetical protein
LGAAGYISVFPRAAGVLIRALEALGAELVVFRKPIVDDLVAIRVGCGALAMLMTHALRVVTNTPTQPDGMIEKPVAYGLAVLVGHDHQDSIFAYGTALILPKAA